KLASTTKLYVATLVAKTKGDNLWLIDSNAIKHMAFDPKHFVIYTKCFFFKIVYLGDNLAHEIMGKGNVSIVFLNGQIWGVHDVLHIHVLKTNSIN
ncbi:unnamed protein product, partial [Sphagnum jensenii]